MLKSLLTACALLALFVYPAQAQTKTVAWDPPVPWTEPVLGYRVYRDGPLVTTTSASVWQAAIGVTSPSHVFGVSAVYATGESAIVPVTWTAPATPPPTPPPTPPQVSESPDGTTMAAGSGQIVLPDLSVWTLGVDHRTMRNQVWMGFGYAVFGVKQAGMLYVRNATNEWYRWSGSGWPPSTNPIPVPPPPNPVPNPTPPPTPPPVPPVIVPAPVITTRPCPVYLEALKPATAQGTGWQVQYFDGGTAITSISSTVKRPVTLSLGGHLISAQWTKTGLTALVSQVGTYDCR